MELKKWQKNTPKRLKLNYARNLWGRGGKCGPPER